MDMYMFIQVHFCYFQDRLRTQHNPEQGKVVSRDYSISFVWIVGPSAGIISSPFFFLSFASGQLIDTLIRSKVITSNC